LDKSVIQEQSYMNLE